MDLKLIRILPNENGRNRISNVIFIDDALMHSKVWLANAQRSGLRDTKGPEPPDWSDGSSTYSSNNASPKFLTQP